MAADSLLGRWSKAYSFTGSTRLRPQCGRN